MTRRICAALACLALGLGLLAGCAGQPKTTVSDNAQRFTAYYFDVFDTMTQVIAYCDSQAEFDRHRPDDRPPRHHHRLGFLVCRDHVGKPEDKRLQPISCDGRDDEHRPAARGNVVADKVGHLARFRNVDFVEYDRAGALHQVPEG